MSQLNTMYHNQFQKFGKVHESFYMLHAPVPQAQANSYYSHG